MIGKLRRLARGGESIRVALVGAGAMGQGIAQQLARVPGVTLSFVADRDPGAAQAAARLHGRPTHATTDALAALADPSLPVDVLVESTNTILAAHDHCVAAIERGAHCVLMNAEVDLVLGFLLRARGRRRGVVVTSDAGDQHGVLAGLLDEIEAWGLEIAQVGNMKGFLDRYRSFAGSVEIARQLNLSTEQCLAYTDGSKLNIEMSIIANEHGLRTVRPGMRGPQAARAEDALALFDLEADAAEGAHVDYILGAGQHGGGVYAIARCRDPVQSRYLRYYKVPSKGEFFLFLRPFHLCHFETIRAIGKAYFDREAVCALSRGRTTDCYAHAKRALAAGEPIRHAIGSDEVYGLIMNTRAADAAGCVPQGLLACEDTRQVPRTRVAVARDEVLTWDHLEGPHTRLRTLWEEQCRQLDAAEPPR